MRSNRPRPTTRSLVMRRAGVLGALLLLLAACSDSDADTATSGNDGSAPATTASPITAAPAPTSAPPTTATPTTPAPTTAPPTTAAPATTLAGEGDENDCAWPGDPVTNGGFPSYSDGDGFLTEIRMAGHGTYDRFVLEFEGDSGVPTDSYVVSWSATPPEADGSGLPVEPAGDWYLEVRLTGSMFNFDTGVAYDGPTSFTSDTDNLQEALSGGSFEGYMLWVLGANEPKGFNVFGLADPSRLVIDVCTGGPDWG